MNLIKKIFGKKKKFEECPITNNCLGYSNKKICISGKKPFENCGIYKKYVKDAVWFLKEYHRIFNGIDLIDFNPN